MYIFILMAAVTEDFAGQLISSESLESSRDSTYLQANGGSRTSTLYNISLFSSCKVPAISCRSFIFLTLIHLVLWFELLHMYFGLSWTFFPSLFLEKLFSGCFVFSSNLDSMVCHDNIGGNCHVASPSL